MHNMMVMATLSNVCGSVLSETLGDDTKKIINVISTPMEDKDISKELKLDTSRVRTILNELLVRNLVTVYRFRHDTGYCNYSWVRREDKINEYVDRYLSDRITELDNQLSCGDLIVFECGCKRVDYGTAIEQNFTCPDCGGKYGQVDASKGSRQLKSELKRLSALRNAS